MIPDAVITYYEKKTDSSRGYDSILSKWKNRIRPRIGAFCAIINNVEENHESGSNDIDVYQKACAEYKMIYRQDFTLEHCYNILKDHKASSGINLNNEADEPVEETYKVQPMGQTLRRLRQELVADVELANNLWHELNRYLEQLLTRALELLRVEALPDDPLVKVYPEWVSFVKSVTRLSDDDYKRLRYNGMHEEARKDVERAFGALKKQWAILATLTQAYIKEKLAKIMYTCIILHNMIIKGCKATICPKWYPKKVHQPDDLIRSDEQMHKIT
nr:protein ALP1-like [Tanacetum cinerariifolium]